MKKHLFFAALAAIALASCSNDETTAVNQGEAISFRPLVNGLTRASSTSDVNVSMATFNVTAFKHGETTSPYIDDATYNNNSSTYYVNTDVATNGYGNEYYWPAVNLDFYAYAYNSAVSSQITKKAYNQFEVTPVSGLNGTYADLVFATIQDIGKNTTYETSKKYGPDGVPLNFRHTGAKIAVNVKNTSTQLEFDVEGWKVGFLDPTATFTLGSSETSTAGSGTLAFTDWAATTATETSTASVSIEYESTFTSVTFDPGATSTALDGEMILNPQRITAATAYASDATDALLNHSYIAVKLRIKNHTNDEVIAEGAGNTTMWAIWPIGDDGGATPFNWEPGKKYTYTIDLANGGYYEKNQASTTSALDPILEGAIIKFVNVTVDEWSDADGIDVSGPSL